MGDPRRFDAFAKLVVRHVPLAASVADVAGGRGYLQAALRQLGYRSVVSWDKRKRYASGRAGYRYGWFDYEKAPRYDAVVAMHPDEATDQVVLYATKHRIPALVCPCCVKPQAVPYWGDHNYRDWCSHLTKLATNAGAHVQWTELPIVGRSAVMMVTWGHS